MSTNKLNTDTVNVIKEIANNLNIDDVKQGSYLNTLVRGLSELNNKTLKDIEYSFNNINVDTADIEVLEEYGNKKSMPRIKNQDVSLTSNTKSLSLSIEMYTYMQDEVYKLFDKGDTINEDVYQITFLEDVVFNTNFQKTYVSCNLSLTDDYTLNLKTLDAGTVLKLSVPFTVKNYIRSVSLNIETNLSFSNFNEDEEVYRSRLKHHMASENVSNKSSIEMLLNKVPYVSQYYIDKTEIPYKVYFLNNDMYTDKSIGSYLEQHSIPYATGSLDRYRGYTSSFEFEVAKKISYSIDINFIDTNYSVSIFDNLNDFLHENHLLGKEYQINKEDVDVYLNRLGIDKFIYDFKIYFYFEGVQFPIPSGNTLYILRHEYPYLEDLTVNGEKRYV